ncbi:MAG: hypothetical protein HVN35_00685 [Methanobacteriaceae archaeon]|nr:hypothetical protein [Methanobacteriaceae archaeon]
MAEDIKEMKKVEVWDYLNITMVGFFLVLFSVGAILQSFYTSTLVPLVIEPPIVAYVLSLATFSLALISLGCCFLLVVLWIFTFRKYVNREKESPNKRLDTIYSICILFIVLSVLQSFFSFLGTFYFAISPWQYQISVIIASLGLLSLVVCYIGLLRGNFSFKKYVDPGDYNQQKKFNLRTFTGRTLLVLTISSVPVSFLAFGWLGLILEWLVLLIPFYLIFGTDKIIKFDK